LSAVSSDSSTSQEPLRERLFSYLRGEIGGVGKHTLVSAKDLAARFEVTPVTISKHLHALEAAGYLHTKAAGPRGTIIALEKEPRAGAAVSPRLRRRTVTAAATATAGPATLRRVGNAYFCPWCGSKIQRAWRFCNRCGDRLPH
jgi:DNA-binding transcriptional regulator YhcF (GntR family)